jgi:hypothetical protein
MEIQNNLKWLEAKIARSRRFHLLKDKRSKQMPKTTNNLSAVFHSVHLSSQCVNLGYQEQLLKPKKIGRPRKNLLAAAASSTTLLQHKENIAVQIISIENVSGTFQTIGIISIFY